MAEVRGQLRISPIAYDHLRVFFSQPVAVTDTLRDLESYVIVPITEGANNVEVVSIRGIDSESDILTYVDLQITRATIDATYQLKITGIKNADQDTLVSDDGVGIVSRFKSLKTKTDSMINGVARMYDTKIDSTLRGVVAALALEDERVGGQGELSPTPLPNPAEEAYGSSTHGSSTYGG